MLEKETNDLESKEATSPPAPPEHLRGVAREECIRQAPRFESLGIGVEDFAMVETYCMACETARAAYDESQKSGLFGETEGGKRYTQGNLWAFTKAGALLDSLSERLGFGPQWAKAGGERCAQKT